MHTSLLSNNLSAPSQNEQSIGNKSTLFLFLFAFIFRSIYVIQSTDNPLFGVALSDAFSYAQWSQKMVDGIWLWDHVGNYLPVYPAFLALQQMLFGPGPFVTKILQSALGALSAVLMAQVAACAWNRRIGLISGYLLATYWMLVIFESEKFAEPFSIFFQSLTLWLLIRFNGRRWAVLAAGFAFALCAGARANLFLTLPFIMAWLIWKSRPHRAAALRAAVLFAVGSLVVIGPIVARNFRLTGVPMLRAQATWSLYSGLTPEFEGLHPPEGILFQKHMVLPYREGLYSEVEMERFWGRKLGRILREHPIAVGLNFLRRVLIFLNAREWSQEFDVYAYRSYSKFLSLPWPGFGLIGPLGILGLFLTRRLTRSQWLIVIYTLVGFMSIIAFKVSDRYRLPTAVLLTVFAAVALWHFFFWIQTRNRRALVLALPALGLLGLVCWPDWQNLTERKIARHSFHVGRHYESIGRYDAALAAYQKSMDIFDWDPDSPYRIGHILFERGRPEAALDYLNEALRREPDFPEALNEIARIRLRAGDLQAAEKNAAASLDLNPIDMDALMLLAEIYRRRGSVRNELDYLKRAVTATQHHRPAMLLAGRFSELGNHAEAIRLYDSVMRARQVDRAVRVSAGMLAGITTARFLQDADAARPYWQYVINEFNEFKFFALQAEFLNGTLSAETLRRRMGHSSEWQAAAEYVIGLKHWLEKDAAEAERSFRRCLEVPPAGRSQKLNTSQQWAREDLLRLFEARPD